MQLRDYQLVCVEKVKEDITNGKNALCVLAVRSGKTVILSSIVRSLKGDFLILVNKSILIDQIKDTLLKFGIAPSIYSASKHKKEIGPVTIGTIQSFANYKGTAKFDYIIVDEAHRFDFEFGQISKVFSDCRIIGFTATPFTSKGPIYGEGKVFTHKTYVKTIREMTESKNLVPLIYKSAKMQSQIDFSNVKKNKDDYVLKELQEMFLANEDKVKLQVEDALKKSEGYKKILVVTTGIEHAKIVYNLLDKASIIHSKQTKSEQERNLKEYTHGNNRFLVSVLIVSEGFNDPPSQVLWLMRPTRSPVLMVQAIGRVLTPHANKDHALLLDYGNVIKEMGSIYDLNEGKGTNKLKLCTNCETYNRQEASECFSCGNLFLLMCPVCFEMKAYGTKCCPITKESNPFKNLTLTSYEEDNKWQDVSRIIISMHTSKAGNTMPKASYYKGFQYIVTEYFYRDTEDDVRELLKDITQIKVKKEGQYLKVKGRR